MSRACPGARDIPADDVGDDTFAKTHDVVAKGVEEMLQDLEAEDEDNMPEEKSAEKKIRQGTLDLFGIRVSKPLVRPGLRKERRRDARMSERVKRLREARDRADEGKEAEA